MPLTLVRTTSEENVQILAKESRIIGDKSSRFPAKCVCFNGTGGQPKIEITEMKLGKNPIRYFTL